MDSEDLIFVIGELYVANRGQGEALRQAEKKIGEQQDEIQALRGELLTRDMEAGHD